MAHFLDDPYTELPEDVRKRAGFQFEREICELLRRELPDDYWIRSSVYLLTRDTKAPRKRFQKRKPQRKHTIIRELDIVVTGPNGLFYIDAKWTHRVQGKLRGPWTYVWLRKGKPARQRTDNRPIGLMQRRITQGRGYLKEQFGPWGAARAIWVVPDSCDIQIGVDHSDERNHEDFRVVHAGRLTHTILDSRPPIGVVDKLDAGAKLSAPMAERMARVFVSGVIPVPNLTLDYRFDPDEGQTVRAPNGMQYVVYRFEHVRLGHVSRGKCYPISDLGSDDLERFEEAALRHARAVSGLSHPNLHPFEYHGHDESQHWFVHVDAWIDGSTLQDILENGETVDLKTLAQGTAAGLDALHKNDFVLRTMAPRNVLIAAEDGRPVLTDLESAKGLSGELATVFATDAEYEDPYTAPEIIGNPHEADPRADVYSWAAVLFHVATGMPPGPESMDRIDATDLPDEINDLVKGCLEPGKSNRPASMCDVLAVLERWN